MGGASGLSCLGFPGVLFESQRCAFQSQDVFRVMQDSGGYIALVHIGLVIYTIYILHVQLSEQPYLQ